MEDSVVAFTGPWRLTKWRFSSELPLFLRKLLNAAFLAWINVFILLLNHGGSLLSHAIVSWWIKLRRMLRTVLLKIATFSLTLFKGGLSGSDDLAVFKCFRVIFFLKNQTIQFAFSFNLYFQQKDRQSCQLAAYWWKALFEFLTSQTGKMAFIIFNVIIR